MRFKITLNKQALSRIIEALTFVALGMILGVLLVRFSPFEFEWKFNVIDFIGLILTFVILFYLQNALSTRFSDDRVEKDLLIEAARKVVSRIEQISESCRASAASETLVAVPSMILSQFKELNKDLRSLQLLLDLTPIRLDMDMFRNIRKECLNLKRLATRGKFPSQQLSRDENSAVQQKTHTILALVYKMVFHLNRL